MCAKCLPITLDPVDRDQLYVIYVKCLAVVQESYHPQQGESPYDIREQEAIERLGRSIGVVLRLLEKEE
jgi:hypothetical protein